MTLAVDAGWRWGPHRGRTYGRRPRRGGAQCDEAGQSDRTLFWGILENPWNGALLDALPAVCQFTAPPTWNGAHPLVELVTITRQARAAVEARLTRLPQRAYGL